MDIDSSLAKDAMTNLSVLLRALVPWEDQHMNETPRRVIKWLSEYSYDPDTEPDLGPVFEEPYNNLVLVDKISFTSLCAHHLLPFRGKAAIGYIPAGRVVGLSKLPRVLEHYAKRITIQERITDQVADFLEEKLQPKGVAVVLHDVEHQCMTIRGVEQAEAKTTTVAVRGVFQHDQGGAKSELMRLVLR